MFVLALASAPVVFAVDASEQASAVKEKMQSLRDDSVNTRRQIAVTVEERTRITAKNVELRPQFEKYKSELVKMQEQAKKAAERADTMKANGEAFFTDWEKQTDTIQNPDNRKRAESRMAKRKASYNKILSAMQEAKSRLVPFMSDLSDIQKMLEVELTANTVASARGLIRQASDHGQDVTESLMDVERELDRVAAEFAQYQ
jgi:predicted  nucleic acid-binding Zn-ribbon protein